MASYCVCIRFALDLSKVVRHDDEACTGGIRFSGSYTLDGVEKPAQGEGGGAWNWVDEIIATIQTKCLEEWGDAPDAEDILDAVERTEVATIAVHWVDESFRVLVEDVF